MGKSKQKTVKIRKEPCDKSHYYTAINLEALADAAKVLDGDGFKMWVYFSKNQAGYELQLSSKHAMETFGLSKDRYNKAIHALTDKGYLVDTNTDPEEVANHWTFYEAPHLGETNKPLQEKSSRDDSQESKAYTTEQIRNNTKTINTKPDNSPKAPEGFMDMTDRERRDFFSKYF